MPRLSLDARWRAHVGRLPLVLARHAGRSDVVSLYTQTVKNLRRAPYLAQVQVHLIKAGASMELSGQEAAKVARVQRFLPASDCAREIIVARGAAP